MAADEQVLGALHTKVAETLNVLLEGTPIPTGEQDEDGNEVVQVMPPSAAVLTSAIQFLKNNNITCVPSKNNALGELEEKMALRKAKRATLTGADLASASESAGFMMGRPN